MGAYVSEVMFWLYRPLTFMLWGGVFERFPRLKAMVVGTMFMVPSWLMLLDHNYTDIQFSAKLGDFRSHLSMAPSEYFAQLRHPVRLACRVVIWICAIRLASNRSCGVVTSQKAPATNQYYVDTFFGFDETAGPILGENAINFYGMDRDYLGTLGAELAIEQAFLTAEFEQGTIFAQEGEHHGINRRLRFQNQHRPRLPDWLVVGRKP